MTDFDYGLLEQPEEDNLHKSRLLPVEQRPFQRVTKRLLSAESPVFKKATTSTDGTVAAAKDDGTQLSTGITEEQQQQGQWRQDMLYELSALENTTVRIQLLRQSNVRERERYAGEKLEILTTAQEIRANTAELRLRLERATTTLALRRQYDELAGRITSNRMLRPREDQHSQLEKLRTEIAELEMESTEYKRTWAERREQFGRIVEEGKQMLRLIKDEKEEAERKEGMEGGGDDGEGSVTRGEASTVGTPRIDGDSTPLPHHQDQQEVGTLSAPSGELPRVASPSRTESRTRSLSKADDMEMGEVDETEASRTNVDSDIEEGEEQEDEEPGDKMDM